MAPPSTMHEHLTLEPHGPDVFVGVSPRSNWGPRVYGGLVVAQALWGAAATVGPQFRPHSLHAYFLRGGTHAEPIRYEIDRIRNGRSFATRRVVARQSGGAILNMSASFHLDEDQADLQTATIPDVPAPNSIPANHDNWSTVFERREVPCDGHRYMAWIRTHGTPESAIGAAAAAAFVSDDFPMNAVWRSHPMQPILGEQSGQFIGGEHSDEFMGASLDHAIWFHRQLPRDEWLLFDMRARGLAGGRGTVVGEVFSTEGVHLASLAQECLLRELS